MKILTFLSILFITFILTIGSALSKCKPSNPCCCQEYPGGWKKCFTSGICCLDGIEQYWHEESCFDFKFWVEPEWGMFTVGKKTSINLYILNNGGYTDDYNITYIKQNFVPPIPSLVHVDMAGVSRVDDVVRGEIRTVYPRILVLSTTISGEVFFNATSQGDQNITRNATLTVLPSDLPASLPEFGFSGMVVMIILAVVVFILFKKFS